MAKIKKVLILGASEGLGYEISKNLLINNHEVFISSSNIIKLKKSYFNLKLINKFNKTLGYKRCDVSKEKDVQNLFNYFKNNNIKLDGLINCAGIYGPKGKFYETNFKDWKNSIEINLLGTFLINKYAISNMKNNSSIINLSGGGATKAIPFISSYCASKSAVVRITETFARELELEKKKIYINSLAPGALNTKMLTELMGAGKSKIGKENFTRAKNQLKSGGDSIINPVEFCRLFIENNSFKITGKLISAKWDNWRNFKKINSKKLNQSDRFTLIRKI